MDDETAGERFERLQKEAVDRAESPQNIRQWAISETSRYNSDPLRALTAADMFANYVLSGTLPKGAAA